MPSLAAGSLVAFLPRGTWTWRRATQAVAQRGSLCHRDLPISLGLLLSLIVAVTGTGGWRGGGARSLARKTRCDKGNWTARSGSGPRRTRPSRTHFHSFVPKHERNVDPFPAARSAQISHRPRSQPAHGLQILARPKCSADEPMSPGTISRSPAASASESRSTDDSLRSRFAYFGAIIASPS
jgi:hypothetical protein